MLPMLLGLAGSGLAGAGMLGGMGALTAGALGSGLGSYLETGDLGQGIQTGLMSFLGGKLLGAGADKLSGASGAAVNATSTPGLQAGFGPPALNTGSMTGAQLANVPIGQQAVTQNIAPAATSSGFSLGDMFKDPTAGIGSSVPADATIGQRFSGAQSALMTPESIGAGLGSALSMPPPDFEKKKYDFNTEEAEAANRDRFTPGSGFKGGIDPEFNYFGPIQYAEGGPTSLPISPRQMANKKLEEYMDFNKFMIRDDEASQRKDEFEETLLGKIFGGGRGLDYEGRQRANRVSMEQLKEEYPELYERVSKMNEGGIAALRYAEGGDMDMSEAPNDKELISEAVDAIKGKDDNPEIALARFVSRYGEDALRDLVERVQSGQFDANAETTEGKVSGVGDGMDDMIPATLEGEQDVVLSDGEFIVPADVVSGLGNGSTDAGSKSLYEMMDRVREMRTGGTTQPKQVPQGKMLPA